MGKTPTEARYRELGLQRVSVRLPAEYVARLDALCAESGYSRMEQIMGMIDAEREELARIRDGFGMAAEFPRGNAPIKHRAKGGS